MNNEECLIELQFQLSCYPDFGWSIERAALQYAIAALSAGEAVYVAHKFWGASEADCPKDIKASNGELHTLRCKVCGKDNDKNPCSAIVSRQVTDDMVDVAYEAYADMYDVEYTQGSHIDNRRACIKSSTNRCTQPRRGGMG